MTINDVDLNEAISFSALVKDPSNWLYGSEERDKILLHTPSKLPRFAHLARKAYIYYGREHYNPHTISTESEFVLRDLIKSIIEYKVQGRIKNYDWEFINNYLMKIVSVDLELNLPYDQKRIDRGLLPEFKSPFHDLETGVIN